MERNKEPLEARFCAVKDELARQIWETCGRDTLVRIASNEEDGGSRALLLSADGRWEIKIDMGGYHLGRQPLWRILTELGEITNKKYSPANKDQLLEELIGKMETKLSELRS